MPDIEAKLDVWRRRWHESLPPDRRDALPEIEDHLWCAVDELRRSGAAEDEAVDEAMRRLGEPSVVGHELARVPARPLPWLPARVVVGMGTAAAAAALAALIVQLARSGGQRWFVLHTGLFALGYLATLCVGLVSAVFVLIRMVREPLPGQARTLDATMRRLALAGAAFMSLGLVAAIANPSGGSGHLSMYNFHLLGGAVVLLCNVAILAEYGHGRPGSHVQTLVRLGLGASASHVVGCYGAMLIEGAAWVPGDFRWLLAVVASHGVLVGASYAPANCLAIRG